VSGVESEPLHIMHWSPTPADGGPGAAPPDGLRYVLVHGSMDRASSFGRVQTHLRDAEIIAYDRRGYAGSAGRSPSTSLDDQVDDLVEVLDHRPAVALGHSLGGTIVLTAASRYPELIVGAVIWEAPMPWLSWWPATTAGRVAAADGRSPEDVAEAFVRRVVGDRIWNRLPPATRATRRAEGPALVAEMRALSAGAPFDPADIAVPVIVGCGSEGQPHQRRGAAELAAALPHGELVEIDGCGHGAHLSHPADLAVLLSRVCERVSAGLSVAEVPR
jgi:pimeloyl-ACP methyl ester carboxylesterase